MDNCKIIEDLLPSYCDGLTSDETNELIRSHVEVCPDCARLLERMSAEPKREILDHREQFRRALKMYENKHRMKVLRILLCCALAVFAVILIWANSFNIALLAAGIDKDHMVVVEDSAVLTTGWTTQFILHITGEQEYTLTQITKNDILNFWYVDGSETTDGTDKPYIAQPWFGGTTSRWYAWTEIKMDNTINYLYVGNNAAAAIEFAEEDIPRNVMVKVSQQGNLYWIHIASDDMDAMNSFEPIQLLLDRGILE